MRQTEQDIAAELRAMYDLDQASEPKAHHEDIAERLEWRRLTARRAEAGIPAFEAYVREHAP